MAFTVFSVFMMCLIASSFVMYLAGLALDAVRGSGSPVDTAQQAAGKSEAAAEYGAQTIYLCR
jgi:hypothetical protein